MTHEEGKAAKKASRPEKGEEMSDKDVAKLIVVKPSRQRVLDGGRVTQGPALGDDLANVISDGLYYYERELQGEVCFGS